MLSPRTIGLQLKNHGRETFDRQSLHKVSLVSQRRTIILSHLFQTRLLSLLFHLVQYGFRVVQ